MKFSSHHGVLTTITSDQLVDAVLASKPRHVVFDIFDTLIHRRVHPEDVKKLTAKRLLEVFPFANSLSWRTLYGYRQEIERELCFENQAKGLDLEFSFPSFTQRYFNCLVEKGCLDAGVSEEQFRLLMQDIELSVEHSVQYADPYVKEAIQQLHERGMAVSFLSDFYLPSTMLSTILSWHGVDGCYQNVVASSDFLETKRSGKLYKRFLEKMNLSPAAMLMVGDNKEVDGVMALQNGFEVICIDRVEQYKCYKELAHIFACEKTIMKELNALFPKNKIFPELSLSLFNFIRKLHGQLVTDGVRDVFFLSREGQPLQRLFASYQQSIQAKKSVYVRSHYFFASRRSTFIPSLGLLEQEDFSMLFRQYRRISLRDFLLSLGMDEQLGAIAQELSVDPRYREEDFPTSETFYKLLANPQFVASYEEKRAVQRRCFFRYLEGFGVDVEENGLALVDVGWKGTIQDNIHRIVGGKYPVSGYYLGMLASGDCAGDNRKQGILFSCLQGTPSKGFFVYRDNTALFEVILAADHGSASHYEEKIGRGYGVLEDFEKDAPLFERKIQPLLSEQEKRFEEICALMSTYPIDDGTFDRFVAKKHARMVYFPRRRELDWFTSIYHRENFGLFEDSEFSVECHVPLKHRLAALYRLVRAPHSYLDDTFWPALKLKESGLNFMIYPYSAYRFYRQLRKGEV